jgi:hypothetical protein
LRGAFHLSRNSGFSSDFEFFPGEFQMQERAVVVGENSQEVFRGSFEGVPVAVVIGVVNSFACDADFVGGADDTCMKWEIAKRGGDFDEFGGCIFEFEEPISSFGAGGFDFQDCSLECGGEQREFRVLWLEFLEFHESFVEFVEVIFGGVLVEEGGEGLDFAAAIGEGFPVLFAKAERDFVEYDLSAVVVLSFDDEFGGIFQEFLSESSDLVVGNGEFWLECGEFSSEGISAFEFFFFECSAK